MGPQALTDFAGNWRIMREIADQKAGQVGRLTGEARFTADAEGLAYHESGWLEMGGGRMQATRDYLWREGAERVDVLFGDGRYFHSFDLGQSAPEAAHWCDPDQYDVTYDFSDWPCWRSVWIVKGPRKDYRMETQFSPL